MLNPLLCICPYPQSLLNRCLVRWPKEMLGNVWFCCTKNPEPRLTLPSVLNCFANFLPQSLLNRSQARWAKEMLGNVRLACCVAGGMDLVPKEADVLEVRY